MSKSPQFPFYAQDFLVGTAAMTDSEVGVYVRLLCYQWAMGKLTKSKFDRLGGEGLTDEVRAKFDQDETHVWNPRLEAERLKRAAFLEKQSVNGRLGGRPKKPKRNPTLNPKETQKKPKRNPFRQLTTDNDNDKLERKGVERERELVRPWSDEVFLNTWDLWKDYRTKELKCKPYKVIGEQAALHKLAKICADSTEAIEVIKESMANGWRGLFPLKGKGDNGRKVDTYF